MAKVDPVTLQVIASGLSGIAEEMQNVIHRTGFSTIIRESQDTSCAILDRQGRVVGQHVILPLHMGAFPACVEALLERYPLEEIEEGDAFVSNHTYFGGSPHASDMAVITPAFYGRDLVGFCCSMAHKSDIGGTVPGSGSGQAREIFHEGIHLPPVKYMSRYRLIREVEEILKANSRTPELVVGDIHGQIGTNRIGERRLKALMDKYGQSTVLDTFEEIFDKTEARLRLELLKWRDGTFEAEGFIDNDGIELGRPVRLHVRITKTGDRILFDFTGSDDQARGPVNIRPPLVRACCYYCLISLTDPTLPNNHGLARVVETRFRERSVLNPALPAPVNCYIATAQVVVEIILQALSEVVPDKILAGSGGDGAIVLGGRGTKTGRAYVQYEIFGSAYGARLGKDGVSAADVHLGNCRITPVEIIEAEFPIRMQRFELIRDSAGAGRDRGGLSFVREYLVLEEEARFSMRSDKHVIAPKGLMGGRDGRPGACIVNPGTPREVRLHARIGDFILKPGDVLRVERAGGGGIGSPLQRDPQRVLEDVLDGYVSAEAAREVYGVAVDLESQAVDVATTARLRGGKGGER